MATLIHWLNIAPTNELLRALNSEKDYCHFKISVFNVGANVDIKNTDAYVQINPRSWNGYDFIIENDSTTKYYIIQVLRNRELSRQEKRRYNKGVKNI